MSYEGGQSRPAFTRGLEGLRRRQDEDDVRFQHDLMLICHYIGSAGWPEAPTEFASQVASYFPDVEGDGDEWPDWSASEILEFIVHDLAEALRRSADPDTAG